MPDKATRERLKAQAAQQRAEKVLGATTPAPRGKTPHKPTKPKKAPNPALYPLCAVCHMDKVQNKSRLPHGSAFLTQYSETTQTHKGTLRIPHGDTVLTFSSEQSGLFRLLRALDDLYREWLKVMNPPTPSDTPT